MTKKMSERAEQMKITSTAKIEPSEQCQELKVETNKSSFHIPD